jgi:hypothetical protein
VHTIQNRYSEIAKERTAVPTPERFKVLRKQLNEHEGAELSVEVLLNVYTEQRTELARRTVEVMAKTESNDEQLVGFGAQLQKEMEDYPGTCRR